MPLNLNGPEINKMVDKIANENKLAVEANTVDGVTVTAAKTWSNGWGVAGYFRAKSKKDVEAGAKAEVTW